MTDTDVSYEEWRLARLGRTYLPGVWLTIDGGEIVQVVEQYQP